MMWKCHVHILTGILRKDQSLINWAKGQIPGLLCYSRKIRHPQAGTFYDDGFYPDGSFIQHYFFVYTGGYGKHFLNILSGLLYVFRDTDMEILDSGSVEFLCEMVEKAYAPLIVDGRFMDKHGELYAHGLPRYCAVPSCICVSADQKRACVGKTSAYLRLILQRYITKLSPSVGYIMGKGRVFSACFRMS